MAHPQTPSSDSGSAPAHGGARRAFDTAAIAAGAVSLILLVAPAVPYYALQNPWLIPVFVLGAAAAIGGIALVPLVLFLLGLWSPPQNRVFLEGIGPQSGVTATVSSDTETRTLPWPAVGNAQYTTSESSAWITITAPTDSDDQTVGCKIYWNDELVVEKTSDLGTVSCEYDVG